MQAHVQHIDLGAQKAALAANAQHTVSAASALPSRVKIEKPKAYNGNVEDASVLDSFIWGCELYFQLTGATDQHVQAKMALLWLEHNAAIWWLTDHNNHPLEHLTWGVLHGLLEQHFRPIDASRYAPDEWATCYQGKGSVHAYVDNFCHKLLYVHDTAPAEVLDCFLCGLNPSVSAQVLVADPNTFVCAALLAKYMSRAHGKAARNGPQPMDLGAVQGSGIGVAYHGARRANGTRTGHSQGGQNGQQLCYYCKQPGHFMLS